jgi:hypothetical protein
MVAHDDHRRLIVFEVLLDAGHSPRNGVAHA